MAQDLESIAAVLVADSKGILAADESIPTLTKRFDKLGIKSTEQSRRAYREMLFTSEGIGAFISGVILYDETIRQKSSDGTPLAHILSNQGILPGIKVDTGDIRARVTRRIAASGTTTNMHARAASASGGSRHSTRQAATRGRPSWRRRCRKKNSHSWTRTGVLPTTCRSDRSICTTIRCSRNP